MELPRATFDTWLKDSEGMAFDGMDLLVQVPSVFTIAWLEQRMYQTILRALRQSSGELLDVRFRVSSDTGEEEMEPPSVSRASNGGGASAPVAAVPAVPMNAGVNFDRKYSFNNFVVGTSNRMAFSAAQAVADA